jgi:glycosyltransferase involved in cell wall biosynthesis
LKIVSWHPVLTDHQSYTLEALKNAGGSDMHIFVLKQEHADRQAQGWVNRHAAALAPQTIPQHGQLFFIIRQLRLHRDATHLFSSPFEQPWLILALIMAIAMGRRVYLISEPYSPIAAGYQNDKQRAIGRLKALLRPALYKIYGVLLRRRITGVFCISSLAISQYRQIGIKREKLFPFGYFVPRVFSAPSETAKAPAAGLKLIFIGTLIVRKGLDVLIEAVSALNRQGAAIYLDVYGPGDASRFDFDGAMIRYCGLIPFGDAQPVIAGYDLLILPSRYDGWGVVVNEALIAGVPAICSDRVGAAAIVTKWQCGAVFKNEDAVNLALKIKQFRDAPALLDQHRLAAIDAGHVLEPAVAGHYMFEVIAHDTNSPTPAVCPWYD